MSQGAQRTSNDDNLEALGIGHGEARKGKRRKAREAGWTCRGAGSTGVDAGLQLGLGKAGAELLPQRPMRRASLLALPLPPPHRASPTRARAMVFPVADSLQLTTHPSLAPYSAHVVSSYSSESRSSTLRFRRLALLLVVSLFSDQQNARRSFFVLMGVP